MQGIDKHLWERGVLDRRTNPEGAPADEEVEEPGLADESDEVDALDDPEDADAIASDQVDAPDAPDEASDPGDEAR